MRDKKQKQADSTPEFIIEVSWEVCNKVGGIYTVLSTRAKTLQEDHEDHVLFFGPDITPKSKNHTFKEDKKLLSEWRTAAKKDGLNLRIGRWLIPGEPIAVLVDYHPLFAQKDEIYAQMWENFQVDSIHAYGDYDESSMFSVAAAKTAASFYRFITSDKAQKDNSNTLLYSTRAKIIYQAHEWMSGMGMLWLQKEVPQIASIFTTHATSIGRSICGNEKPLYDYFDGYNGDQMARELNMEAKHSIEKQSAHFADCFTTVSSFTARECRQLLEKEPDVVLMNGFEADFVPKGAAFTKKRKAARNALLHVANCLTGYEFSDDTLILSTSGRNDFRCKGFDVYMEAMARLNKSEIKRDVVAFIEVPCWMKEARPELQQRLAENKVYKTALPSPLLTHSLYNEGEDRILNMMRSLGFNNSANDRVKIILIPCYLDGNDGIFNMSYYDLLIGNDLSIYPSYYEPWGYTPLEAIAFNVPCITTDLSGFGQWVDDVKGKESTLADGVLVLHRTDGNYFEVADGIRNTVMQLALMNEVEVAAMRKQAGKLAEKALWKHFIPYYYKAYKIALEQADKRINKLSKHQ